MKLQTSLFAALAAFLGTASAAPIPLTGNMTYTQNFDSLGTTDVPWIDDSTLPGWWAEINNGTTAAGNAQAADGTVVLSGLLNLGTSGATDRALGSKATGTGNFANIAYGVQFQNTSASPIQVSEITYSGELWRTNSGASVPEDFTLFYDISPTQITDIISGGNSTNAAAGAGFTALGAGSTWVSPTNTPADSPLDGNDPLNRATVTFVPTTSITVPPGQFLVIKWTDTNEGSTDGFQGIDDLNIDFTAVSGLLTPTLSNFTRNLNGTPADPTDDTFGFTLNVAGAGAVGPGWTTTDVTAPNATSANYGTPVVWTGFPVSGPKTVTISDSVTPAINTAISVEPPKIIGTNDIVAAGTPILHAGTPIIGWVVDDTARTSTQNSLTTQTDNVLDSQVIDLSTAGFVRFSAELDAIAGTSSGFEDEDSFTVQLIIDDDAPISVLGDDDVDSSGRLIGLDDTLGVGTELPGNDEPNTTKTFSFESIIPDTADKVQIRIIGNSNSPSETFVVKNVTLSAPSASLFVTPAGPVTLNNQGTVSAADDTFSGQLTISPVGLGASPGWTSDSPPPAAGSYTDPQPVTFGPYLVSGGAKTVTLTDVANPAINSGPVTIALPTPTVTVSAPANITRVPNGPGPEDDVVTFDVVITGANGGPGWTATGGTPASGTYSANPVTFTVPAGPGAASGTVIIADASYPAATQTVVANFAGFYVIGQKNLGGGLSDVNSTQVDPPNNAWVNDPVARTLTMNDGDAVAGEKTIMSEEISLAGVSGPVLFSANLHIEDTSSGFEAGDTFTAFLIYDGNAAAPVSLISDYDTDASGRINGAELAAAVGTFDLALTDAIPDTVNTVQLVITGLNDSASEIMRVENVLFSLPPVTDDSDGDGMSDADETIAGTSPTNPTDVLRLSQSSANPNIVSFPTKGGRFYKVYSSPDLATWTPTALATFVGDDTTKQFDITGLITPGRKFFRLHVMETDGPWN